uniref:6(G)-fructosyltransferase n=1 Tax=Aegilops tauschii TaxID=37682 RepID=M8C1E2_AEGTA
MTSRDPTTAWFEKSDKTWRTVIGSKDDHGHTDITFMYKTKDFVKYKFIPGPLHRVEGTGMWVCIDFYPVGGGNNLSEEVLWTPLDPEADVGIRLRYNWGKLFASMAFNDSSKQRCVLWGYVGETDSKRTSVAKGWASLQPPIISRTVALDEKTRTNLLQWPVEEIDTLRLNSTNLSGITLDTGSVFPVHLRQADQLDIEVSFHLNASAIATLNEADVNYNYSGSGASSSSPIAAGANRWWHKFYVSRGLDGGLRTQFCNDELQSSRAGDVVKRVVGSTVPVLDGEALFARVLVDHSIVESFAMGGRLTVTSRLYPTEAIYMSAGVYLSRKPLGSTVTINKLVVHEMALAPIQPYVHAQD